MHNYKYIFCYWWVTGKAFARSNEAVIMQQSRTITGTVISKSDNTTVIGATIVVVGTNLGTITDMDGKFIINNIPSTAKEMKVSFVGMKTQTLPIRPNMIVYLDNDSQQLDEVIVVAYGTAKKVHLQVLQVL